MPKAEDIVDVVIGQPGPTSDIKICRETLSKFDSQQLLLEIKLTWEKIKSELLIKNLRMEN
nr:hypothetical protein [Microcystis aeruginosa]